MADAAIKEAAGAAALPPRGLARHAAIGVAAVLIVGGSLLGGYLLSVRSNAPLASAIAFLDGMAAPAEPPEADAAKPYHDLPPIVVNLRQTANARFIKLGLTLGIDPARLAEVERLEPHILEAMNLYLRELDEGDLAGSAGIHQLKTDLERRIRLIDTTQAVRQVFIRELMIQ